MFYISKCRVFSALANPFNLIKKGMRFMAVNKKKVAISVTSIGVASAILFGGTFAWQSISQTALNEVSATVNPGGRLHDDFVDITCDFDGNLNYETMTYNKDVYVENFTSLADNGVQVYARVRLDEYMELGVNAGGLTADGTEKAADNQATSLVPGAKLEDKSTWATHIPGEDDVFHRYWNWDLDGKTTYMPTFNKNKDSLAADINGTFANDFADYTEYTAGATKDGTAVYDADDNIDDEIGAIAGRDLTEYEIAGNITTKAETHTAKETLDGTVITMTEYLELLNDSDTSNDTGNFWVWDEADGWAYWANPISPDTATGLLLDGISRTEEIINEDWYYGINVVAQFITADDIGQDDGTGFYDPSGAQPSDNALLLLNEIGVDVSFEVSTVEELETALAHGGNITLTDDVTVDTSLVVAEDTVLNLNGNTISNETGIWNEEDSWSLISATGADTTLTIKGGTLNALENDCYAVDIQDGATVVIEDGSFIGNISAVYVHKGSLLVNGGTFSVKQLGVVSNPYGYILNAYDTNYRNGDAKITVCGGTFAGLDPANSNDGDLVPTGYTVTCDDTKTPKEYTVISD